MEYHRGSVLGSLLFNLYMNDLSKVCHNCNVESYVHDSKLYMSFYDKDVNGGLDYLRQDFNRVPFWCFETRLLINTGKTEFCVFYSNRILMQTFILPIMFLGKEFTVVGSAGPWCDYRQALVI